MEIRIYNADMNLQGIIENQTSLLWTRRYNSAGNFELHTPITDDNRKLLRIGNLVYKAGSDEAGVIESIVLEESFNKNEITCKGRFLESYMDRRITKTTKTYSGKTEEIMRTMLSADTVPIPRVMLGELNGYTDEVSFQCTYKNLLAYMEKLAKSANYGFRFRPNFNTKKIIFEIYKGVDRSNKQGINNRVIFSEQYENLNNATYTENSQNFRTKVFVGGEGEGADRLVVSVGGGSGLDLREEFYSATDVSSQDITREQYIAALMQKGRDRLEYNSFAQAFECVTEPTVNFVYKKNYDLGDVVTVKKKSWDITVDLRITEIQEIYENGLMVVSPTLGTPLPDSIDWEDK